MGRIINEKEIDVHLSLKTSQFSTTFEQKSWKNFLTKLSNMITRRRRRDLQRVALPCFCGQPRTRHETALKLWLCHQCWKVQRTKIYYYCKDDPAECISLIGDKWPNACAQCAFVQHDTVQSAQEIDDHTVLKTIDVALDKIG